MLPSSHSRALKGEDGEGEGRGGPAGAGPSSMMYSAPPPPPPSHLPSMRRPLHPTGQQLPSPSQHRSPPGYGFPSAGDEGAGGNNGGGPPPGSAGRKSPPGSGHPPQGHRPYMKGEHDGGANGGHPPTPHARHEYHQGPPAELSRRPTHLQYHRGRQGEPPYGMAEGVPNEEHHPRSDHMSHGPPEGSPRDGVVGYVDTYDHDDRSHMYRHGGPPPPPTTAYPRGSHGNGGYSEGAHAVSPQSASPPRGPEGPSSYGQPLHPPHSMPEGYVVRTQSYASSSTASQSPRASPTRMHPVPPPPSSAGSSVMHDSDMTASRSHMRRFSHAYPHHEDLPPPHHHTKAPLDSRSTRPMHHYPNVVYGGHHRHPHDPSPRGAEHWRDEIPPSAFGPYDSHHAGRDSPSMRSTGRPRYPYKTSRMSPHADDYGPPPRHMGHYVYDERLPPPRGPPPPSASPHVERDEMDHYDRHARHYYPSHHPDDYPYYGSGVLPSSSSSRGHPPRRPSPTTPPDPGCHVRVVKHEGMDIEDGSERVVNSRGLIRPDPSDPAIGGGGGEEASPTSSTASNVREGSSSSLGTAGGPGLSGQKRDGEDPATMGCTCKKSKCLKLYCQCFAASIMCGTNCRCLSCMNTPAHEQMRRDSIKAILGRNPNAFDTKFKAESNQAGTGISNTTKVSHKLGCKCRKSACLKKYCECYHADVKCSTNCRCVGCQNMAPGGPGNGKPHVKAEPVRSFAADVVNVKNSTRMGSHGGRSNVSGGEPWMMNAAQNLTFLKNGSPPEKRIEQPIHHSNDDTAYHHSREDVPNDMPSMPSLVSGDEAQLRRYANATGVPMSGETPSSQTPPSRVGDDEDENECPTNRGQDGVKPSDQAESLSLPTSNKTNSNATETKPGKAVNTLLMAAYAMTELHSGNSPPSTPTKDDRKGAARTKDGDGEHHESHKEVIENHNFSNEVGATVLSSTTEYPTQALKSEMRTTITTNSTSGTSRTPPNKKELTRHVSNRSPKRKSSFGSGDDSPSSEAKQKRLIPPPHIVQQESGYQGAGGGGGDDSSSGSLSGREVRSDKEEPRERLPNSQGVVNSSSKQMPPIPTSVATPTDPRRLKRSRLGSARKSVAVASGGEWGNSDDATMEASATETPSGKPRMADHSYSIGRVIDHTPRQATSTERTGVESEDETSSATSHHSSPSGCRGTVTPTLVGGTTRPMHRQYLHQESQPHHHHPISSSSSSSIATPMDEWHKSPGQEDQEMGATASTTPSGAPAASTGLKLEPKGDLLTPVTARCMAFRDMDMNGEPSLSERPTSAVMATESPEDEGGDGGEGCDTRGSAVAPVAVLEDESGNTVNAVAL